MPESLPQKPPKSQKKCAIEDIILNGTSNGCLVGGKRRSNSEVLDGSDALDVGGCDQISTALAMETMHPWLPW